MRARVSVRASVRAMSSNAPLSEKHHYAKNTLWERSTRVPLAIVAPGVTKAASRSSRPVSLIDLYPTLVELCGLPERKDLEGVSLKPLLDAPRAEWERPALMTFGRGNHAVRSERFRYISYAGGGEELYDHSKDPNEWTNLASDPEYAAVVADHKKWLPKKDAPRALMKRDFEFDEETYTWERK